MKLPGGGQAIVDIAKLRNYCLNLAHPRGRYKARVFLSVLKLSSLNADFLREQLLHAAHFGEATKGDADDYGTRYVIDLLVEHEGHAATVRSAWIVRRGETSPRFTSCYVL